MPNFAMNIVISTSSNYRFRQSDCPYDKNT